MISLGLDHLAHAAASTAAVLNIPARAKSVAPTVLTVAGFTPLQIEVMVTGVALFAQAVIFAALRIKTALPRHGNLVHRHVVH
jgi:hypothetical protein